MSNSSRQPRKPESQPAPTPSGETKPATNVLWLDLETTGRNAELHGIVEIGALFERNGEVIDTFQCYVRPFESDQIQQEAMNVHKLSLEFLHENGKSPFEACQLFVDWLSKYIDINGATFSHTERAWIKGWRVHFDLMFLQLFFEKLERKDFFMYFRSLAWCVGARFVSAYEDHLHLIPRTFHLTTALQFCGVETKEPFKAHSAIDDINMTRLLDQQLRRIEAAKYKKLAATT